MNNNKYRIIPIENYFIDNDICHKEGYPDAVFCSCGKTIHFKGRKPFEVVIIKCPCGKEFVYG